jgi:hypothetical protein
MLEIPNSPFLTQRFNKTNKRYVPISFVMFKPIVINVQKKCLI